MNACPLVSVIIPTYNREKYIKDTIMSVLGQTYQNIEIIVVDDGSTDNTKKIVNEIIQSTQKKIYYYYKENEGVSKARNVGIDKANGSYIAFLDSDDTWDKSKIEKQLKRINETSTQACYCGRERFFTKYNRRKKFSNNFKEGKILYDVLKGSIYGEAITWLISKDLLDTCNLRFSENCTFSEDLEFFLKLTSVTEVCCVKEYLCQYNIHDDSLTGNLLIQFQEVEMWKRFLDWVKNQKSIPYNYNKIKDIIEKFRIPACILRILFDSLERKQSEVYKQKETYNNELKKLNIFLGDKKITILFYYLSLKYSFFYRIISFGRKQKMKMLPKTKNQIDDSCIMHVTPVFEQGGTETYILNLIEFLKSKNINSIVVSGGGIRENQIEELNIKHIKITDLYKKNIFLMLKSAFIIADIIKNEKIAIIHASSVYTLIISRLASLISRSKPKVIMTLHGGPTREIEKAAARILNIFADKVIALSHKAKEILIENGLSENKIVVINNGIKPFEKLIKTNDEKLVVGTCGRLTEQKGFKYLIESASIIDLDNVEYWIIGDGELKEKLEKQAKDIEVEKKIKFLGFRRDVNQLLNFVDIFVLPSLWEPFGISIIEAMSLGKPVIASKVGGIPEVLGDTGILINPGKPEEIAEAIKMLVENPELRKSLGEKAEKRFYENFTQDKMGEKTLEVYKELLSQK